MVLREIEDNAYAKFWRANKLYYGRCANELLYNVNYLTEQFSFVLCRSGNIESHERKLRFPALENLYLDHNELTDLSTFASLAGLRKYGLKFC